MGGPPGPREARPEGKPHDPPIQGKRRNARKMALDGRLGGRPWWKV